jgi:hypothetical protein
MNQTLSSLCESPESTSFAKLPPRATFQHHARPTVQPLPKTNSWQRSLDWDLQLFPSPDAAERALAKPKHNSKWDRITVPGNWETQGYGKPHYP